MSSRVLLIAKRYEHTLGEIEDRTTKSKAAVMASTGKGWGTNGNLS